MIQGCRVALGATNGGGPSRTLSANLSALRDYVFVIEQTITRRHTKFP